MDSLEFNQLRSNLGKDVEFFKSLCNDSKNAEIMRRSYVRSLFAFIEGYAYAFKQISIKISKEENGITLEPEEIIALREIDIIVNEKGDISERPKYISAQNNLNFSFCAISKQHEINFNLDKSAQGWKSYCQSMKIRDRLMHPKKPDDLNISDSELDVVHGAYDWFLKQLANLEKSIRGKNPMHNK